MNIYTSNFAKARKLSDKHYLKVSISRFPPKEYHGANCPQLAPSPNLLNDYHERISESEYETRYRQEMNSLQDIHYYFEVMANEAHGRDIVLLCYEKKNAFCHRHILSDIIFEKYNYRINEL